MTTSFTSGHDLEALRARLSGAIVVPGDQGWDDARRAWNLVADQRPAFVVIAGSARDVVEVVRFARAHGLRVAPQNTGHGAASLADLAGTILLRLAPMAAVTVDPAHRTARVEGGARWADVVAAAAPHGLTALHGGADTVGVAGYTVSGGLGWLARRHGLACNHVHALKVVTADGVQRHVTAGEERGLFWALRGGGGGQAVVTALEFDLLELGEIYAGSLMWPIEQAATVVRAWAQWTREVPDTVTSALRLVRYPPLPQLPESLRGRSLAVVMVVHDGDGESGARLVARLRGIGPYSDTVAVMPATSLSAVAGEPTDPVPVRAAGALLHDLDDAAVDTIVELAGPGADIPLLFLELRHLGGALAISAPGNGALDRIGAPYMLHGLGVATNPDVDGAIESTLDRILARMQAWSTGRTLLGFAQRQRTIGGSFPPAVTDRLVTIKADVDPDGLIVPNSAIAR